MAYVLTGFMGAGKSSAATELAAALGGAALDSDNALEAELGEPIAAYFEREGEAAFRDREERLVLGQLAAARENDVLALGGGAITTDGVRAAVAGHTLVFIDTPVDVCWSRASRSGKRPLASDRDAFFALYREREHGYVTLADAIAVAPSRGRYGPLAAALARRGGDEAQLLFSLRGDYPVFIGAGSLNRLEALVDCHGAFLVSDENVLRAQGGGLLRGAPRITITPGERSKTLREAEAVWGAMVEAAVSREGRIVALGGGVVGDLAGFCAACYQRGIPVVQVPTSLVAQVDSAYGGKTGVDLERAKNYVGAYHQPQAVLVDPDLLATLPAAERSSGWAEVVKTALIAGGWLWEAVRAGELTEDVILGCVRTKLAVVAQDERDAGRRQVLNLGHTVGHAIEAATGYRRYRHGEAVALGMLAALRLSERAQLRSEVGALLAERGLPTRLEGCTVDAVLRAVALDKKRDGDGVPFVLVGGPGDVHEGARVADQAVRAAVQELMG